MCLLRPCTLYCRTCLADQFVVVIVTFGLAPGIVFLQRGGSTVTSTMPMKRPAAMMNELQVFETHLKKCSCGGNLSPSHEIEATLYDMLGQVKIKVRTWRCTSYGCRLTFGPNFAIHDSDKVNTAQPAEVKKARALFVSNKIAFSSVFLEYHARMEFRACVSSRAVQDVSRHTFGLKTNKLSGQWRKTRTCRFLSVFFCENMRFATAGAHF